MSKKINNGTLAGMSCPECHSNGPFVMEMTMMMDVDDAGGCDLSTSDDHNAKIKEGGNCICKKCNHQAKVEDFYMEKQYLASGGNECPSCGSVHIDADTMQVDGTGAWQDVICGDCDFEWQDQYQLTGIEIYKNSSQN